MRKSCLLCVLKHLGAAAVLMDEARLGYAWHKWLAAGHMVEAEAEMLGADSALAGVIRTWRVKYMGSDDCRVPMEQLIGDVVELMVPVSPTVDHDIIDPGLARAAGSAWRYGTVDEGDLDDARCGC
jgi:hypothetical protein